MKYIIVLYRYLRRT